MKNIFSFGTEYLHESYWTTINNPDKKKARIELEELSYSLFFAFPLLYNSKNSSSSITKNIKIYLKGILSKSKTPDSIANACISLCKPYFFPEYDQKFAKITNEYLPLNSDKNEEAPTSLHEYIYNEKFSISLKQFVFLSYIYNHSRYGKNITIETAIKNYFKITNKDIVNKSAQYLFNKKSSMDQKLNLKGNLNTPFIYDLLFSSDDESQKSIRLASHYDFPFVCGLLSSTNENKNPFLSVTTNLKKSGISLAPFLNHCLVDNFFAKKISTPSALSEFQKPIYYYLLERLTNTNMINQYYESVIKTSSSFNYAANEDSIFYDIYKLLIQYPLVDVRLDLLELQYKHQFTSFENYKTISPMDSEGYSTWHKVITSHIFVLCPMISILFHILMGFKTLDNPDFFNDEEYLQANTFTNLTELFSIDDKKNIVPKYLFPNQNITPEWYSEVIYETIQEFYQYLYKTKDISLLPTFFNSLNSSTAELTSLKIFNNYVQTMINRKINKST